MTEKERLLTSRVPRRLQGMTLRGRHLIVFDLLATLVSFVLSLALRFDAPSQLFDLYFSKYLWVIPLLLGFRVAAFLALRLYQTVWRYASVEELLAVVTAVLASSVISYAVVYGVVLGFGITPPFPRSIPIIDTLLVLSLTGAWRFALRVGRIGRVGARSQSGGERTVVVGSGPAAIAVLRELRSGSLPFVAVGIIADDLAKGQRLTGLPVLGRLQELGTIVRRDAVSTVLLALPAADGKTLRWLMRAAEASGARCLTVPSVAEVIAGRVTLDALREIDVEDLLRRAPARIDIDSVAASFSGRSVLITGAGGSIGSELARQLVRFKPRQLVLMGRGENSIFEAVQSISGDFEGIDILPVILDIRDAGRVRMLVRDVQPDIVFHAAAHKHVSFMETFPEEAVAANVLGTARVIDACLDAGVQRFVLISSDKAVNPTGVMGATKRVSELLVQDAARRSGARYVSVRFGNVLSSRGSVVPLFRRQLERGGPITITHEDVARFFMTIPEAVQLVLQAAVMASPGDTFVLDMGDPVRIIDLARDLAALHGLELGQDVEIRVVGLRPGEKLVEELWFSDEEPESTAHEAIRRVGSALASPVDVRNELVQLEVLVERRARSEILRTLVRLVPEFHPYMESTSQSARRDDL